MMRSECSLAAQDLIGFQKVTETGSLNIWWLSSAAESKGVAATRGTSGQSSNETSPNIGRTSSSNIIQCSEYALRNSHLNIWRRKSQLERDCDCRLKELDRSAWSQSGKSIPAHIKRSLEECQFRANLSYYSWLRRAVSPERLSKHAFLWRQLSHRGDWGNRDVYSHLNSSIWSHLSRNLPDRAGK